jgi:hypothetical protein
MNKNLLIKGMIFLAGGAIGSVVTWKLVKTKYEQIIADKTEENEFLRDRYSESKACKKVGEALTEGLKDGIENPDKLTVQEIRDKVQELGYINEQAMKEKEKEEADDMGGPEVIAPEETWEQDYPMITLTYYEGDGVLADERDRIIGNIDEMVGEDFASHFGEYEDDTVYIKNPNFKSYYEILRDYGSYSEVVGGDED